MSARRNKRNMAPFIVSASDLAFIMLFFFIIVGNGSTQVERIEVPFKQASAQAAESQTPFRIEVYDQDRQVDSSRMALIYNLADPPETLFVSVDNRLLQESGGYTFVHDQITRFLGERAIGADSASVDVFSGAHSYYGLVALAVASCQSLQYPCNLVYRAEVE
ncbi:MAG: hypothetical protein IT585_12555 [candidate division Zixibacteria bacterium]|nr:hypothetical protein [candidate division Zixibacteria bacterium]